MEAYETLRSLSRRVQVPRIAVTTPRAIGHGPFRLLKLPVTNLQLARHFLLP